MVHSAVLFEREMHRKEVHAKANNKPSTYFVVTNPEKFQALLDHVLVVKKATFPADSIEEKRRRKQLERKREQILQALQKTDNKPRINLVSIGAKKTDGLVDLVRIPVTDLQCAEGTIYEGHDNIIFIGGDSTRKSDTIFNMDDFSFIHTNGRGGDTPALTKLEDLFIEAREGSDLTSAERLFSNHETDRSLRILREAAEYTIWTWIRLQLSRENRGFVTPENRTYFEYAKKEGFITGSDSAQARAFMYVGNAAVHSDFLKYHRHNAILFHHWLTDFIDKTIGFHRMSKSRINGTSFSDTYAYTQDGAEYELRRAIFDQIQAIKRAEAERSPGQMVHLSRDVSFYKEVVMGHAINVIQTLKDNVPKLEFCDGDSHFLNLLYFWRRRVDQRDQYTPADAVRAAFFAYFTFFHSKQIDSERIKPKKFADLFDPNQLQAIRRKGMHKTRFAEFGLARLADRLEESLDCIQRVAHTYFIHYLPKSIDSSVNKS